MPITTSPSATRYSTLATVSGVNLLRMAYISQAMLEIKKTPQVVSDTSPAWCVLKMCQTWENSDIGVAIIKTYST